MSRTVLALAVMFSLCGGPSAAVPSPPFGQQPSSGKPDLSGRWVLNQAASDDAREKLQGVVGGRAGGGGGRPGGRGGGGAGGRVGGAGGRVGGAGGRAGGFGGRSDAGQAGEMRDTLRGLAIAPPLLIIAQRESEVTITGADGHAQVLRPDGRKVKEKLPAGGDLERVTKWTGGTLVTETKSRAGLKITQAYSRGDGPSLLVTLRLEIPRVGRPVQIRRMYDVATAAEVAATPPPAVRMGSEASTGNQALRQLGVAADPESVFKAMSGGRDTVGKEQFRKYLSERLAGRPIAERPEALDRLFDRLDADKNGSLTLVEFKALGTLLGGGRITGTATARRRAGRDRAFREPEAHDGSGAEAEWLRRGGHAVGEGRRPGWHPVFVEGRNAVRVRHLPGHAYVPRRGPGADCQVLQGTRREVTLAPSTR